MNNNYPLIKPVQSENYPFWVYNNYAYLFDYFNNNPNNKFSHVFNDEIAKPVPFLSVKESVKNGLMYIEDHVFDRIIEKYYGQNIEHYYKGKWNYSGFSIKCFSCDFDISENRNDSLDFPEEIDKGFIPQCTFFVHSIEVFDNEYSKSYPDSQKLDLLVKEYLKDIEPDFTRSDLNNINLQIFKCDNNVDAFFTFHFKEYQGEDPHVFVNHSIQLTNEVWNDKRPKNTDRKRYFDKWIESKINEGYLDRSKLKLETELTIDPPQQENAPVKNTTYYPASYTQIAPSTKIRSLWVYNNLIHIKGVAGESFELKKYKNHKEEILYVRGDDYRNRLDDFFGYIKQNISGYRFSIGFDFPKEEAP